MKQHNLLAAVIFVFCFSMFSYAITVQVTSPLSGSTVSSPVTINAHATSSHSITGWWIYVDGVGVWKTGATQNIAPSIAMSAGTHQVIVRAWNNVGNYASTTLTLNVKLSTSAVSVSISPSTAVLQTQASAQFTASVSGTTNTSVAWLVNGSQGGNSTVGTISAMGLYTAPSIVPSGSVTVSARSMADSTKSASANVSILPTATSVGVAISPTSVSIQGGQSKQFTATVSGTSNMGIIWQVGGVTGGNATLGMISSSGLYVAPACPSVSAATVTARSAYDSSASSNSSVTFAGNAPAGTSGNFYVATNGSDSNDGSACRPWATIRHAASLAQAGWTIHVAPGTYSGDIVSQANGTATARIRYISDVRWGAKIVGSGGNNAFQLGVNSTTHNGNYTDIVGFDVTGNTASRIGIATYAHDSKIIGNRVHDVPSAGSTISCFAGAGIYLGTGSLAATTNVGSNLVDGNYIYNISTNNVPFPQACNQSHGIYAGTNNNTMTNNIVFHNAGFGIHVYGHTTNEIVVNNTTFNNGYAGIIISSDGTVTDDYTIVKNNISINNGVTSTSPGIKETSYPSGHIGSHNVYSNNITFGNTGGGYSMAVSSPTNSITTGTNSGLFINYTGTQTGDYHIQAGGPAANAGTLTNAPSRDFDGSARSTPDIGAFEVGSSPALWPWQ
ncbi:MAG: hypothetical protein JWO13_1783 [Acidobacteriales bacterium]|nr:hypothetical protein [Terriglobales bacterium]